MRTTVDLDDDNLKAIERLRATEQLGVSEAVNRLIRQALVLAYEGDPPRFEQRTAALGLRIDVSNTAAALEDLEGPTAR